MLSSQEIKEIERKWSEYNKKRYLKLTIYIVPLVLLLLIAGIFTFFDESNIQEMGQATVKKAQTEKKHNKNETFSSKPSAKLSTSNTASSIKAGQLEERIEQKFIKPKIKKVAMQSKNALEAKVTRTRKRVYISKKIKPHEPKITATKVKKIEKRVVKMKQETPKEIVKYKPKEKKSSSINETIRFLTQRFNEHQSYEDALRIAEAYYDLKKYKKAIKWAVEANTINPSDDKSWILFAKSEMAIGKKNEAIKVLRAYLDSYYSKEAKILLQRYLKN
jgi:tetratricopeptide (TPR) repeat protein